MLHSKTVVLNRRDSPPTGASLNLKGGASPYAPHKMESLFVKFTNKYTCFHSLFRVREEWNKGQLFKREKRLRTTALKNDDTIFNQSDSVLNQILNKLWLKSNILKFDSRLLIELIQSQIYSSFIQINIYSKMSKYTYWMIFDSMPLYDLSEVKLSVRNALTARRIADCTLACNY